MYSKEKNVCTKNKFMKRIFEFSVIINSFSFLFLMFSFSSPASSSHLQSTIFKFRIEMMFIFLFNIFIVFFLSLFCTIRLSHTLWEQCICRIADGAADYIMNFEIVVCKSLRFECFLWIESLMSMKIDWFLNWFR